MAREHESRSIIRTHFIFLVHGFMGNPEELSYFKDAIEGAVVKTNSNIENVIERDILDTADNGDGNSSEIITHRVTCNENKTFDGIESGGKRVAQEVQDFVIDHLNKKQNNDVDQQPIQDDYDPDRFHASISFIGYSLGGMYARYAISVLPLELELEFNSNKIILHRNCFVTAATPHLGMASHSYIAVPRFMEYLLGYGSGRTGRDLFRLHNRRTNRRGFRGNKTKENCDNSASAVAISPNDLVYKMATDETFLNPLSAFRRRVSYINAFDTDFMVPTATAGMLSPNSNTEQHLLSTEYDHWKPETIGFDVFAFETKTRNMPSSRRGIIQSSGTRSQRNDETVTMASSLDSLGWTKVFVDCRKGMHGPSIRCICRHPRKDLLHAAIDEKKKKKEKTTSPDNREEGTGENGVCFESKELCKLLKSSEHWHIAPTGHFVLVAHSKTERGAKNYAKGRPLVDQVALDLVNDVIEIR